MSAPLAYDGTYLKSISGIIKISCMICCFLGFLCIVCSSVQLHNFRGCFYTVIILLAFICSSAMLLTCLFQVWQRKFYTFNAIKYEFYLNVFLAFICFTAGCASISLDVMAYTIATICCFLGFLCIVCSSVQLHNFRGCFYTVIILLAFICSSAMLLTCLFQVWQRKFYTFNAIKYEFYLNVFLAFICFTAGCASISLDVMAYTIATFFAFLAFSFYAFDGYLGYRLYRQCDAQTQTQTQPQIA